MAEMVSVRGVVVNAGCIVTVCRWGSRFYITEGRKKSSVHSGFTFTMILYAVRAYQPLTWCGRTIFSFYQYSSAQPFLGSLAGVVQKKYNPLRGGAEKMNSWANFFITPPCNRVSQMNCQSPECLRWTVRLLRESQINCQSPESLRWTVSAESYGWSSDSQSRVFKLHK